MPRHLNLHSLQIVMLVTGFCWAESPGVAAEWPPPPFEAELSVWAANIHQKPDFSSPVVGLIQQNGIVRVVACLPSCEARRAWALLEQGALPLALLRPISTDPRTVDSEQAQFVYGKVMKPQARVKQMPEEDSATMTNEPFGRVLAFVPDDTLAVRGWLIRYNKGYMRLQDVRLEVASPFNGEPSPPPALAFLWRSAKGMPKFSRFPVSSVTGTWVHTPSGALPRSSVRLAIFRRRPPSIPPNAKWVHVNLREQVLTAYEGDKLVYSTLISSGKKETPTSVGTYGVWSKGRHDLMHGESGPDEYFVEEVPYIQYFHKGQALHGAFWHNRFGTPVTHGCLNLSLADAKWLFDWSPPPLPKGWHTRFPVRGDETLWVVVERSPAIETWDGMGVALKQEAELANGERQ